MKIKKPTFSEKKREFVYLQSELSEIEKDFESQTKIMEKLLARKCEILKTLEIHFQGSQMNLEKK